MNCCRECRKGLASKSSAMLFDNETQLMSSIDTNDCTYVLADGLLSANILEKKCRKMVKTSKPVSTLSAGFLLRKNIDEKDEIALRKAMLEIVESSDLETLQDFQYNVTQRSCKPKPALPTITLDRLTEFFSIAFICWALMFILVLLGGPKKQFNKDTPSFNGLT